ncbi:Lactoylglutathione lyase [Thalictrum thalictroides]|uniref:Lactoylglutathione lyase n=1 Tax=Thalictrum thalictroides TaxID=46969 RepID=A0A7J6W8J8_THATH|nr:Lactoylglutathione lyase [Thalictrum thalictroides]
MVRILPMASSSLHLATLRPCFSSLRISSSLPSSSSFSSRSTLTLSSSYNPSRRLTLFHLGTVIPQAQIFGIRASKLVKSEGYSTEAGSVGNVAQASTAVSQENALEWVKKDNRRMLHVVYRVGDLDKTIK